MFLQAFLSWTPLITHRKMSFEEVLLMVQVRGEEEQPLEEGHKIPLGFPPPIKQNS